MSIVNSNEKPKRKNRTSIAAVNRYNQKTYKNFGCRIKPDLMQRLDAYTEREQISKPEFLSRAIDALEKQEGIKMMYTIKPEFWELWGASNEAEARVDLGEIERLAAEWEKPVAELVPQLEPMDSNKKPVDLGGHCYTWETIVNYMDDEIREQLHNELAPCTEEAFLEAYLEKHLEKYGKAFEIN